MEFTVFSYLNPFWLLKCGDFLLNFCVIFHLRIMILYIYDQRDNILYNKLFCFLAFIHEHYAYD